MEISSVIRCSEEFMKFYQKKKKKRIDNKFFACPFYLLLLLIPRTASWRKCKNKEQRRVAPEFRYYTSHPTSFPRPCDFSWMDFETSWPWGRWCWSFAEILAGCGGDRCSGLLLTQVGPLRTDAAVRMA